MRSPTLISVFMMAALMAGFAASARAGDGTVLGTLGGAALGGFVGSQFGAGTGRLAATGAGVFVGGLLGNSFGRSLDRADRPYYGGGYSGYGYTPYYARGYGYYEPLYVAPPASPPPHIVYVQPAEAVVEYREREPAYVEGGYLGAAPAPARSSSRYCREYTQQVRIGNEVQESYGTACLQPDGSWRIEK